MPTPSTSDLPKLASWDEFEEIVGDIYSRLWQGRHAQCYGRSGSGDSALIRYLTPGRTPLAVPGAESIRSFLLGPPKDLALLQKSDPGKRAPEGYQVAGSSDLGFMAAVTGPSDVDTARAFDSSFETPMDGAQEGHLCCDPSYADSYLSHAFQTESLS